MGGNRGLTHGCKGVPEILLVNNAISVLVNYGKSLWRVGVGTGEVRNGPKASALLPQADQILALSQLTPPPTLHKEGRNSKPSSSPQQVHLRGWGWGTFLSFPCSPP